MIPPKLSLTFRPAWTSFRDKDLYKPLKAMIQCTIYLRRFGANRDSGEEGLFLAHPAPLATIVETLRSGELDLFTYLNDVCDRIDTFDPDIHALLPEADRRGRLRTKATALQARWPDP